MIFYTITKYSSKRTKVLLDTPTIKQIGGRAGRYRVAPMSSAAQQAVTAEPSSPADSPETALQVEQPIVGLVTTFNQRDLQTMRQAMDRSTQPIERAVIKPPDDLLTRFAGYFRADTPLSYIWKRFDEITQTTNVFRTGSLRDETICADLIHEVKGLDNAQRLLLCHAPVKTSDRRMDAIYREYATHVAQQTCASILELKNLKLEVLDAPERRGEPECLPELELLYQSISVYIWLSYRLPDIFQNQALAFHIRTLTERKMNRYLKSKAPQTVRRSTSRASQKASYPRSKAPRRVKKSKPNRLGPGDLRKARRGSVGREKLSKKRVRRDGSGQEGDVVNMKSWRKAERRSFLKQRNYKGMHVVESSGRSLPRPRATSWLQDSLLASGAWQHQTLLAG